MPEPNPNSHRQAVIDGGIGMLETLADRFKEGEAALREVASQIPGDNDPDRRYLEGGADTYNSLIRHIRDEIARYKEQHA